MAKSSTPEGTLRRFVATLLVALIIIPIYARSADAQSGTCPAYEPALKAAGLPVAVFSRIMYRESRCQPKAIGWNYRQGTSHKDCKVALASAYKRCSAIKSYDSGLLQINSSWVTVTAQTCKARRGDLTVLLTPACNLAVSAALYRSSGIGNWRATSGKSS